MVVWSKVDNFLSHPLLRPESLEYRLYQDRLARIAVEKNTLVVLPTALGKTAIALLVSLHFLEKGKVLFLAPTRPLVQQHYKTFAELTLIGNIGLVTGFVNPHKREKVYDENDIIFATPQAVANDVEKGRLRLVEFSMLVFDEAHRARGNYHYVRIAKRYMLERPDGRVLALTASPGSSKERVEEICRNLGIRHIEMRTEEDEDVKPYLVPVRLEWRKVSLPPPYKEVKTILREMLDDIISWLLENGFFEKRPTKKELLDLMEGLRKRLDLGEKMGIYYEAIARASAAMALHRAIELIESQGLNQLYAFLQRIEQEYSKGHRIIVSDGRYYKLMDKVTTWRGLEHPKMSELMRVLQEQFREKPNSKVIVFTQYRDTARELVEKLNLRGYKAKRFVGQANRVGDKGMSQRDQISLIEDFKAGRVNVLVATSIAEEGLDIAECNMVVFYEPVPSEIRLIQRKGRTGRRLPGRVVVLATRSSTDTTYLYFSMKKVRLMRRVIDEVNHELRKRGAVRSLDEFM